MATKAISAHGTKLQRGDGATPTELFTDIAEVTNISGPGMSVDAVETTSHSSGGSREFIGGLLDGGEVSIDINYVPADHATLTTDFLSKDVRNYKIQFPSTPATTWSFKALMTNFEPSAPVDGQLTASVTLKVTGTPTLA